MAYSPLEEYEALETILTVAGRPPFTGSMHQRECSLLRAELDTSRVNLTGPALSKSVAMHAAAVAKDQKDWTLHDRYASILFRYVRDLSTAERQWRAALDSVPHSPDINHRLAVVLAAQRRPVEAFPFFEKALAANRDSATILLNFGRSLAANGEFRRSASLLRRASQLRPEDAAVHLAWAELQTRRGDYSQAIESYLGAIRLSPDDAPVHSAVAELWASTGRHAESIASYRRAIKVATVAGQLQYADKIQQRLRQLEGS